MCLDVCKDLRNVSNPIIAQPTMPASVPRESGARWRARKCEYHLTCAMAVMDPNGREITAFFCTSTDKVLAGLSLDRNNDESF